MPTGLSSPQSPQSPEEGALDLGELIDALRPHLGALVETIALAGSTTVVDGKKVPGDVRAAAIGLELVSKYLSGRGSDRASKVLREALKLREAPDSSPTEGETGVNES